MKINASVRFAGWLKQSNIEIWNGCFDGGQASPKQNESSITRKNIQPSQGVAAACYKLFRGSSILFDRNRNTSAGIR